MIEINGAKYAPRALTLPEVRRCRAADVDEADVLAISLSCGILVTEARAWFGKVSAGVAAAALGQIFEVSGITEGAQKSD